MSALARTLVSMTFLAVALGAWTGGAAAQPAAFPAGSIAYYDSDVQQVKVRTPTGDYYHLDVRDIPDIFPKDVATADPYQKNGPVTHITVTFSDGTFRPIRASAFTPGIGELSARQAPADPDFIAIKVSNDADTFDSTCDGRAVVVGANSATPVSLIDVDARAEVAKVTYGGPLARAVSIGDDERTVLVVLDSPANNAANTIRRLTLGPGNALADAGEQLLFGADYVSKVRVAPGSKVGVALVGQFPARLVAFSIPGLAIRGSVTLAQGIGSALAFNPSGDRVYARSGRRGIVPDVIEAFALNAVTGAIGQTAALTINNVAGFNGVVYNNPMAMSLDGTELVVVEQAPASRITRFNPATGAVLGSWSAANPRTVGAGRRCAQAAPRALEYYHAAFDHYFVTTIAEEITLLDNGTLAGWTRTGYEFNVHAAGTAGTAATCRFFSTAFGLRSSHFYTPIASECATVKAKAEWQFEGEVFNLTLTADGTCAGGTVPLYRLYNQGQGGAPNHRYTTRTDVRAQMIAQGWVPEGAGAGVIGCVPTDAPALTTER